MARLFPWAHIISLLHLRPRISIATQNPAAAATRISRLRLLVPLPSPPHPSPPLPSPPFFFPYSLHLSLACCQVPQAPLILSRARSPFLSSFHYRHFMPPSHIFAKSRAFIDFESKIGGCYFPFYYVFHQTPATHHSLPGIIHALSLYADFAFCLLAFLLYRYPARPRCLSRL